jgi:hypothetical protein
MNNAQQLVDFLIESLSDHEFFLCENVMQAKTMSHGFVKEITMLKALIDRMVREIAVQDRRYKELMEHKDSLAKEVQCARMYLENIKTED